MKNCDFNYGGMDYCSCKKVEKKRNWGMIVGYGLALGVVLYSVWEQFHVDKEKVKIEQVGKSIDNKFE